MSTRLIRKQTGLTYEPPDAPGVVVEYTLHPEQPFKPATRDSEGQEYIPARVEVENVLIGGLTTETERLLERMRMYLEYAPSCAERNFLLARVKDRLSTKPTDLLPWLQTHGADEDEVIARLEEGIVGNHR